MFLYCLWICDIICAILPLDACAKSSETHPAHRLWLQPAAGLGQKASYLRLKEINSPVSAVKLSQMFSWVCDGKKVDTERENGVFPGRHASNHGDKAGRGRQSSKEAIKVAAKEGKVMICVGSWTCNGSDYLALYPRDPVLSESRRGQQQWEGWVADRKTNEKKRKERKRDRDRAVMWKTAVLPFLSNSFTSDTTSDLWTATRWGKWERHRNQVVRAREQEKAWVSDLVLRRDAESSSDGR